MSKPSKQDIFLHFVVPFVLLGFTAISFVAVIICCLLLLLVMANWSGPDSANAFVLLLQLIPALICVGGLFGFLTLALKHLATIASNTAISAEALTKIVESQSRKKSA